MSLVVIFPVLRKKKKKKREKIIKKKEKSTCKNLGDNKEGVMLENEKRIFEPI